MTDFGDVKSEWEGGINLGHDFDEITSPVSTTSATLVDITGLTFDLVVPTGAVAHILATMTVQCSTTGGSPAVGAWAISIGGVDGTEIQRSLSGTLDTGSLSVQAGRTGLTAGTYTVKGRHRRVSGSSTLDTDVAQLLAEAVLE